MTLFHGLPSNRVHAIAQDAEGAMWFGTDGGLAKYDGRRTQTVPLEGLTSKRVMALKLDEDGVLWVGTETGAGALVNGQFRAINETAGNAITSIITPERGRAILASEQGIIFDCRRGADNSFSIKTIPEKPMESADFERPGPLNLTSLAMKDNVLYIGTRSRGVIQIENDVVQKYAARRALSLSRRLRWMQGVVSGTARRLRRKRAGCTKPGMPCTRQNRRRTGIGGGPARRRR